MKRLLLLALLSLPCSAAWEDVRCVVDDGCLQCFLDSDTSLGTSRIWIDQDTTVTNGGRTAEINLGDDGPLEYCGLAASTKYYFTIDTAEPDVGCASICTDCVFDGSDFAASGSGSTSTGVNCDSASEPPNFTTIAYSTTPAVPTRPTHWNAQALLDATPDDTATVSCIGGRAFDTPFLVSTAAADRVDELHEILIPPGCIAEMSEATYTWPARTGAGVDCDSCGIIIRTNWSDLKLAPPSNKVRIDPELQQDMGILQGPGSPEHTGTLGTKGTWNLAGDGLVFDGIVVQHAAPEEAYRTRGITSGGDTNTLILDATTGTPSIDGNYDAQNLMVQCTNPATSQWTGMVNSGVSDISGTTLNSTATFSDTCIDGTVVWGHPLINTISATGVVTIAAGQAHHGLPDFPDVAVTTWTDPGDGTSVITVATQPTRRGNNYIRSNDVIWLKGTGDANLDNKFHHVTAAGATSLTIATDPAAACASSCTGTYELARPIAMWGNSWEGVYHYRTTSDTAYQLYDSDSTTSTGTATTGGYAVFDADEAGPLVSQANAAERLLFNQTIVRVDPPYRTWGIGPKLVTGLLQKIHFTNSWFGRMGHWCIHDPISSTVARLHGLSGTCSNKRGSYWSVNNTQDFRFYNNFAYMAGGMSISGDLGPGDNRDTTDHTVSRNDFLVPETQRDGSTGFYWNHRQPIEWKMVGRLELEGNWVGSGWRDATTGGAFVVLKFFGNGSDDVTNPFTGSDLAMRGNLFDSGGSGIEILPNAGNSDTDQRTLIQRVEISHNFFGEIAVRDQVSTPFSQTGQPTESFNGKLFLLTGSMQEVWIHHNTAARLMQRGCRSFLSMAEGNVNRFVMEDNILGYGEHTWSGVGSCSGSFPLPSYSGQGGSTALDTFERWATNLGSNGAYVRDPNSEIASNTIIGLLENTDVTRATYATNAASTSASVTLTDTEAAAYFLGVGTNTFPSGASMQNRIDAVFESGTWEQKAAYASDGVQWNTACQYRGCWGPVQATWNGTTLRLTYDGPAARDGTELPCHAQATTSDWHTPANMTAWSTLAASTGNRVHDLTPGGSSGLWRVACDDSLGWQYGQFGGGS